MIRKRLLVIGAAIAALTLWWLCGLTVLGGNAPFATLPSPATMTGCATVKPPDPLSHAPTVVLEVCGTGVERTLTFITGDEWAFEYQFRCRKPGVFIANAYSAAGSQVGTLEVVLANKPATVGWGTVPVHSTPGAHYIAITSACPWTARVTSYA